MKRFLCILFIFITVLTLPVCLVYAETETGSSVLQYGDQGDKVVEIQELLSNLGYYSGKISGNYLEGTRAAIRKFQKEYGLEITGICDSETEALLRSAEYRILSSGCDGNDVKRLQQALIDLGYLDTKATGKFRSATEAAVKAFQKANGLTATGKADVDTQKLLFSGNGLGKGVTATPTPVPGEDIGDVNDMVIAGDGENVVNSYEKTLKRGSTGEEVKEVQRRLKELGFFDGPISGNYMNQTLAAVKEFQKYNGLTTTDGITDEQTWNALFNAEDVVDASATPRPTPEPTPIPYAITVDVRNQAVLVYGIDDEGQYSIPVKWFICSTGMKATPSDVGDWVLNGRKARWCYFSKWGSHAQYWTRINEYIAFHSVIYNSVNLNALSTKSYNKLGQRASHGCVRLLVNDAKWIYDNIGEGTVVTITEERPDDEELRNAVKKPALNSSKTGPVTTPTPTATPAYTENSKPEQPYQKLKKGSEGTDVFYLQCKLKELGYYTGAIPTGKYLSGTVKAVKAYQRDQGLYPSGEANEELLEMLFDNEAEIETPVPETTPIPTVSPSAN